jgi:hypothetical protein
MAFAIKAEVRDPQARTFTFYRQATNRLAGINDEAAAFLDRFF